MSEWIKTKDKLPTVSEFREHCIVYGSPICGSHPPNFEVTEACFNIQGDWEFGEYDCPIEVTHWMPLPAPPKE